MASRASICVGDRVQFSDDECGAVLKPLKGKKRGPDRRVDGVKVACHADRIRVPDRRVDGGDLASAAGTQEPGTPASVGSHHTDDTVVAIAYYNLGVQNLQVTGKHWNKKGGAAQLIAKDIEAIFSAKHGIQVVLLSEFGNMYRSIDKSFRQRSVGPLDRAASNSTVSFFQALLKDLKLDDITVHALAPYVALVNSEVWEVEKCEALFGLCSKRENFAMHLLLKHKVSGVVVRAMNCHIPTRFATMQRKRDTVTKLCTVCTKVDYTNTAHPTPCWVIGGDLNVDEGTLKHWCQVFVKPHVPCVSTSAGNMSLARKSDVAISQGIDLDAIASWVGYDMDSYASDAHNMVAVIGVVKSSGSSDSAAKAQAKATDTSTTGLAPMAPPPGLELEREVGNLIREEPEKDATSPHALEPQAKTRQQPKEDACHDACVVCMDKDREFAAIPCGRLCTCNECSSKLATCPMCQTALADVKWMRIYC